MNHYTVSFEIKHQDGRIEKKTISVEAGNKKLAGIRALKEVCKDKGSVDCYKTILSIVKE